MTNITRRTALRGATAAFVAVGIPMALPTETLAQPLPDPEIDGLSGLPLAAVHIERAVAAMASVKFGRWSVKIHSGQPDQYWGFHQESNLVLQAICRHQRADAAKEAALQARDGIDLSLDANPRYDPSPKVQMGKLVFGMGTPDTAVYCGSLAEIDSRAAMWLGGAVSVYHPDTVASFKAAFDEKRRDLSRQIRRKKRMERQAGLPQADKAVDAAYLAEEKAAMAVMLSRPTNALERSQKASYMRGKGCFKVQYWDVDALFAALVGNTEEGGRS